MATIWLTMETTTTGLGLVLAAVKMRITTIPNHSHPSTLQTTADCFVLSLTMFVHCGWLPAACFFTVT